MRAAKDFRMIVKMVFAIILLTGVGCVALALVPEPSQSVESVQSLLAHAFTAAVGALIGLIGGHSAATQAAE